MTALWAVLGIALAAPQAATAAVPSAVMISEQITDSMKSEISKPEFWRTAPSERFARQFMVIRRGKVTVYISRSGAKKLQIARMATQFSQLGRLGTYSSEELPASVRKAATDDAMESPAWEFIPRSLGSSNGSVRVGLSASYNVQLRGRTIPLSASLPAPSGAELPPRKPVDRVKQGDLPSWPKETSTDLAWKEESGQRLQFILPPGLSDPDRFGLLRSTLDAWESAQRDADQELARSSDRLFQRLEGQPDVLPGWDGRSEVGWDQLSAEAKKYLKESFPQASAAEFQALRLGPAFTSMVVSFSDGVQGSFGGGIAFGLMQPYPPRPRKP